jgi:hypothetical protein
MSDIGNERVVKFFWEVPEDQLAITHGGQIDTELVPPGMRSLVGTSLADHLLVMSLCRDEFGTLGTLVELEAGMDGSSNKGWDIFLLIVIPKRGSLFVHQTKKGAYHPGNPEVADAFRQAKETGEWRGHIENVTTLGPLPGGYGAVLAATGEFAGTKGRQRQTNLWQRITPHEHRASNIETFWLSPIQ